MTATIIPTPTPTPTPTAIIYDDYAGDNYELTVDGGKSPNGKWLLGYHGRNPTDSTDIGHCGTTVPNDGSFPKIMFEYPYTKTNTTTSSTSASLIVSDKSYGDFDANIKMRTLKSLRATPRNWENVWLMWHFNDAGYVITDKGAHFHHYYIMIHLDGTLEFGRKDNTTQTEHQYFLPTLVSKVTFNYGQWYNIRVNSVGNHIKIWIDGLLVVDLIDDGTKGSPSTDTTLGPVPHPPSTFMYSGRFGLYNEDSSVQFGPLSITSA
jgi:hypothetical protein